MHLMILGAPGVGKGTQAEILMKQYNIPQISTGDILRAEVQQKSELGNLVKSVLDAGELVSDDLILKIVEKRISQPDCQNGFILDGFPRTIPQAEGLQNILENHGHIELNVLEVSVPDEEIIKRLLARKRADDTRETIENRLRVYRKSTAPLVEFYQHEKHYTKINGLQSIEEVAQDIAAVIHKLSVQTNAS